MTLVSIISLFINNSILSIDKILVHILILPIIINKYTKFKMNNKLLFILSFTMLVASLWEFFEYFSDLIFHGEAQRVDKIDINDTMQDMWVAFIGSILYIIFSFKRIKNI